MALLLGVVAFIGAVSIYAAIVRLRLTLASARLLALVLFGGTFLAVAALSWVTPGPGIADVLLALAVSWSLALAFLVANTAIETDSPTQSLVLLLHACHPDGATEEMVEAFIAERPFRDSRLRGLIADSLVERRGDRLVCRPGGRLFLRLLDGYRRVILRDGTPG
jgi:hypothetical protein